MSFEKLITELQELGTEQDNLTKSLPSGEGKDDDKIQAAADDDKKDDKAGGKKDDKKDGKDDKDDKGDDKGDDAMSKSLGVIKLADGTEVDALDGTELVKSLVARIEANEGQTQSVLEGAVGLIRQQGLMIKSLSEQVIKLSGEGRGRKAIVTIAGKTSTSETLSKSDPGMTGQEFMAKSHAAYDAGKISGRDLTVIDVSLRQGSPVDPALVAKVMS